MSYNIPLWLLIAILVYILLLKGVILYFFLNWWRKRKLDSVIFIDKNNRWEQHHVSLKNKTVLQKNDAAYVLDSKCGLLTNKGRALYLFSENQAQPLKISYNTLDWLDSKSVLGVIQNKIAQQIVKPTDKFTDMLMILGAIGGILACIASVINLLIAAGVISPK